MTNDSLSGHCRGLRGLVWLVAVSCLGTAPCIAEERFDLSGVPAYVPKGDVAGEIRIQGAAAPAKLLAELERAFAAKQNGVTFHDTLLDDSVAFAGLNMGKADIAIKGQSAWRSELDAFEQMFGYPPLLIRFATGAYGDPRGASPGAVFFVNVSNPMARVTLEQLDGLFGSERTGGWVGTVWSKAAARSAGGNIRHWGQAGKPGVFSEWNDKPVHTYGTDVTLGEWTNLIQTVVFKGGDKWNQRMMEIVLDVKGGLSAPDLIVDKVATDAWGIGFNSPRAAARRKDEVRVLPVARTSAGPYVVPSAKSFQDGSYPLVQTPTLFVNRKPGQPLPARVEAFLRFVLSQDGQNIIQESGVYLPLNAALAAQERRKVD